VDSETKGLEMGAHDFIHKPFAASVLIKRIETHIEVDKLIKESQAALRDIHNATISVIAEIVEGRDHVTDGHIERTRNYLEILLNELIRTNVYATSMAGWDISLLPPSSLMHDVGKINISDLILNKPGKLTDDEFSIIKNHCAIGEYIIDCIIKKTKDDGFLQHAKMFAGYHHEKWDGSGYPKGLAELWLWRTFTTLWSRRAPIKNLSHTTKPSTL